MSSSLILYEESLWLPLAHVLTEEVNLNNSSLIMNYAPFFSFFFLLKREFRPSGSSPNWKAETGKETSHHCRQQQCSLLNLCRQ